MDGFHTVWRQLGPESMFKTETKDFNAGTFSRRVGPVFDDWCRPKALPLVPLVLMLPSRDVCPAGLELLAFLPGHNDATPFKIRWFMPRLFM